MIVVGWLSVHLGSMHNIVVRFAWVDVDGTSGFLNNYWLIFTNDDRLRATAWPL
jgi:hypothetical protein